MSFLHPGFFYASAAAAAIVVALHFLVAEQPKAGVLPTVRFFPDVEVRSTTLAVRLSDILLMLLRVATLLLIGAAFAQPQLKPSRSAILSIVAVDASRDVAAGSEATDSLKRYAPGAASVIVFDSVAREMSAKDAEGSIASVGAAGRSKKHGSLSSALIVALRAASRMRDRADSIELVVVSPFAAEEFDSATAAIRSLWPGRISVVMVAAPLDSARSPAAATLEWPDSAPSESWIPRARPDTIGGLRFENGVAVFPFVRKWKLAQEDSAHRVVARWVDGEPAIIERPSGNGCVRSISVPMPTVGDAILRTSFARLLASIHAPCADLSGFAPASEARLQMIAGPNHLAVASAIKPESARMTPLVPWLLAAALLLALVELFVRRRGERAHAREDDYAALEVTGEHATGKVA